jgi:hypothetical protein
MHDRPRRRRGFVLAVLIGVTALVAAPAAVAAKKGAMEATITR